jgi:hypothetical protein
MLKFHDVQNIVIVDSLITFTPNNTGGPPDYTEMTVRGYETEVMLQLSRLRWTWTGWALLMDIWRLRSKTMLIIPWSELPYIDPANGNWKGFNATANNVILPKLTNGPVDMDQLKAGYDDSKHNALIRYNPSMWTAEAVAGVGFIPKAADFKSAPGVLKDEILLHEMVHGLRRMRNTVDGHKPLDQPRYDTVEEFMAIVVSNVYRSEVGRPGLRADHHGFTALPAAQENAQAFLDVPGNGPDSNKARMTQFKRDNPDFFNDLKKSPAKWNPFKLL